MKKTYIVAFILTIGLFAVLNLTHVISIKDLFRGANDSNQLSQEANVVKSAPIAETASSVVLNTDEAPCTGNCSSFIIKYQCNDGLDNDNDGLIDYPADPGCSSSVDNTELNKAIVCTGRCIPPPCTINSFVANPANVISGSSSTLSWVTNGCAMVSFINNAVDSLAGSMSTGPLTQTTTYTLYAGSPIAGCSSFSGTSSTTGQLCTTGAQSSTVTVTVSNPLPCVINTFTVPSSTPWSSSNVSTNVSWSTSNCKNVLLQVYSGSTQQPHTLYYVPSSQVASGSRTFSTSLYPGNLPSNADTSIDVSILATNNSSTTITSQTKTVAITGVPSPSSNQCAFSELTATPSSISLGQSTTLNWSAPTGCLVFIIGWTANSTNSSGFGYTYYYSNASNGPFPSSGSFTVTPTKSTSYYMSSQKADLIESRVVAGKTIDVKVQ